MDRIVQFPDPRNADDDGLVAIGADLSIPVLLSAYAQGVFPWFNEEDPILWWSPNPRMILFPDNFKLSKSLRKTIRLNEFEVKIDENFTEVIRSCKRVSREGQDGTWITKEMQNAYIELHDYGVAHSFETYRDGRLVGGLYGVSIGAAFFGESMFFTEPNASKVAFYYLVEFCKKNNFQFIDAQQSTSHLKSLGAEDISRDDFLELLSEALKTRTMQGKWKQ